MLEELRLGAFDTLAAVREGSLTEEEGRAELEAQRARVGEDLADILGADRAAELEADVEADLAAAAGAPVHRMPPIRAARSPARRRRAPE